MRTAFTICFLAVLSCLSASEGSSAAFSYDDLSIWPQLCNIGEMQSPIDLSMNSSIKYCDYNEIRIGFQDGTLELMALPNSLSMEMLQRSSIVSTVDYDRTILEYLGHSMSFHAPSEHTIQGTRFDLELHLMHNIFEMAPNSHTARYNKCVLALLFNVNDTSTNNTIDQLLDITTNPPTKTVNFDLVFTSLVRNSMFYHYHGSLTTPPCTENVNWYVMEAPQPIRTEQLSYIQKYLNSGNKNSRPVQTRGSRPVYRISSECNVNI